MEEAKAKEVKCWCGCGENAYVVVMGRYPLCLSCGKQHFKANRLVMKGVWA